MSQHFLLSAKARSLSLGAVMRMDDGLVEQTFRAIRWPDGKPVCPGCEGEKVYDCVRNRFRCAACRKDFSITSGTIFASHKLPLRTYLAAIAIFANEVKGKSALALSRDLDVQYKTAFVLAHKLREAMANDLKGMRVGGIDKVVEVDGAYFGGYVKPTNHKENRQDRRKASNQNDKRQVVVVARERKGKTLPSVFVSEKQSLPFISSRVMKGSHLMADEAPSWNDLHGRFDVSRIDHTKAYSMPEMVHTNGAEGFFSRLRRGEMGHHHHISGPYLLRYAQESAWREDHRRVDNGSQFKAIIDLAMHSKPSVDFSGYWQRNRK